MITMRVQPAWRGEIARNYRTRSTIPAISTLCVSNSCNEYSIGKSSISLFSSLHCRVIHVISYVDHNSLSLIIIVFNFQESTKQSSFNIHPFEIYTKFFLRNCNLFCVRRHGLIITHIIIRLTDYERCTQ